MKMFRKHKKTAKPKFVDQIAYGKKPRKIRIYINERTEDDRNSINSASVTIFDYTRTLTALKVKKIIESKFKEKTT